MNEITIKKDGEDLTYKIPTSARINVWTGRGDKGELYSIGIEVTSEEEIKEVYG